MLVSLIRAECRPVLTPLFLSHHYHIEHPSPPLRPPSYPRPLPPSLHPTPPSPLLLSLPSSTPVLPPHQPSYSPLLSSASVRAVAVTLTPHQRRARSQQETRVVE